MQITGIADRRHPPPPGLVAPTAADARGPARQRAIMDSSALERCQQAVGYRMKDLSLMELALTHSSVASTRARSNERLEFLGDAVLGLVVCQDLFDREDDFTEGQMTKVKSSVVSRQTCAEIAVELGITDLLSLGKGVAKGGEIPQSVSAAVFESIIGAIYLDGGLDEARRFILRTIAPHLAEALENEHQRNYKSVLQQHAQRRGSIPEYVLLDEKGPDHSKCFEVAVVLEGATFPSAWGRQQEGGRAERRTPGPAVAGPVGRGNGSEIGPAKNNNLPQRAQRRPDTDTEDRNDNGAASLVRSMVSGLRSSSPPASATSGCSVAGCLIDPES